MLEFPGQQVRKSELHRELADEFDLAERIFEFWMSTPKDEWLAKSPLSPIVKRGIAMPLNTQACRLFRSLICLCADGDAYSADILARSLFETALATGFVLEEDVPIVVRQKNLPDGRIQYRAVVDPGSAEAAKSPLSRDTRAKLYFAYQPLRTEKTVRELAAMPPFKELSDVLAKRYDDQLLARLKTDIGEAWAQILPDAATFAGVSIGALARALGHTLDHWYKSFYFLQSRNTHAADAIQHANADHGPEYLSGQIDVSNAIFAGISMFVLCILFANNNIGFGPSTDKAIEDFAKEYGAMR